MEQITHRRILRIALPIVLANATVPLLGAVDTAVVGQMGVAAPIGAVGIGAIIIASVYWIFGFLRMGTSGLAAQAQGARDDQAVALTLWRGLIVGLGGGAVVVALQVPLIALAFALAPASDQVEAMAAAYLRIRLWGAPAAIAIYAITGWLIGLERTRGVLVLQVVMNGLNMVLDVLFVIGFGWGVAGVAVATVMAEVTGLALGLWLCRAALAQGVRAGLGALMAAAPLRRMMAANGDILLRSVLLQGAFTSFLFLGAAQGDVALAANQVLLQFLSIITYALDGFAFAAEALVGQAVGARAPHRVRQAAVRTSVWAVGAALVLAVAFMVLGPVLIDLLTTAPEVQTAARGYLPWVVAVLLIGVASWMLDGIFIGALLTSEMRNAMLISVPIYAAAAAVLPTLMGNHGIWAALVVLNLARAVTMARLYPRAERLAA